MDDLTRDDAARRAVVERLDETLFVSASAGSGKTSCLVDRFIALIEDGVAADRIAAITFTEKAAAELVDRIRAKLHVRARDSDICREALRVLDGAAIGTLHSFAQRVLSAHPIEAGLPPRFAVNDEIASQIAFDARWETFADALLDSPDLEVPLRLLFASGGKPKHLRDVAVAFNANWDLVVGRGERSRPAIPAVDVADILAEFADLIAAAQLCTDESDRMFQHLTVVVAAFEGELRAATHDDDRLRILGRAKLSHSYGRQGNWPNGFITDVKDRLTALDADCADLCKRVLEGVLQVIASELARFTAESAQARRSAGELEFHDLLVLARNVLRDPDHGFAVRSALAERYHRLLLDEFQDTDPIQIEIAMLIASTDPDANQKHWSQIKTVPGRLFFVGDPQQSIYRFRRADVAMFMRARKELVPTHETLAKNFRTGRPIVEWVNATFAKLFDRQEDIQPEYQALIACRDAPEVGPAVSAIGSEHPGRPKAEELRIAEATDVAAAALRVVREGWSVGDRPSPSEPENWRPASWRDIAVLLPARTSLRFLEEALTAAGVPYRAETSSLVYGTREIRDLMMVARALDDPTDSLAVVSALRTPAFGCGDDDLVQWYREFGGRWNHQMPSPDDAPAGHPVARGLAWLGEQHRHRHWMSPSQVLELILRERRFFELAAEEQRPRDLWRRLRFVLDQCRAWEEAGGNTLRAYLRWVEGQSSEGTRVIETVLPETDDNAVRILTIHGAKGLEFPIAILSGLTTASGSQPRRVEVRFPPSQGWAIRLSKQMSTSDFDEAQQDEELMDRTERIRLLYVAATRARDHLVVSVHRRTPGNRTPTAAEDFYTHGWDPAQITQLDVSSEVPIPAVGSAVADRHDLPTLEDWQSAHTSALVAARRPVATSATRLATEAAAAARHVARMSAADDPGLAKGAKDIDLPPWQKGRYGSAIGRAVHAVLQTVDLSTGAGLSAACAAQAAAEGVLGKEDVIEALARAALESDTVRVAARLRHWREVYVGVPWGDSVLEGYIDLLYEDDAGLVVVDYKTDAWQTGIELDAKVQRYSVQLRAYAAAVREAVGQNVTRAVLLFLRPGESVARDVDLTVDLVEASYQA